MCASRKTAQDSGFEFGGYDLFKPKTRDKLATIPRARAVSLLEMPRAPGPLPPWAKALEAALRFLGQHLARLRHQVGRQLAKVARRGAPKRLAIGAPCVEIKFRTPST